MLSALQNTEQVRPGRNNSNEIWNLMNDKNKSISELIVLMTDDNSAATKDLWSILGIHR